MDSEWGGQAFPWVIFSHVLRDRGGRELFFKYVGRRAQRSSSSGPSGHFPHDHSDDPTNEYNG